MVGPSLLKFVCDIIAALAAKLACIGNYVPRAGFYTACDYTEMTVIFGCVLRGVIVGFGPRVARQWPRLNTRIKNHRSAVCCSRSQRSLCRRVPPPPSGNRRRLFAGCMSHIVKWMVPERRELLFLHSSLRASLSSQTAEVSLSLPTPHPHPATPPHSLTHLLSSPQQHSAHASSIVRILPDQ